MAGEGGEVGHPRSIHMINRDPAAPSIEYIRVSGGIFLDMTIHDFDMARFLIGNEVGGVFSQASAISNPDIAEVGDADNAAVMLRFAHGLIGTISNIRHSVYGYKHRGELFG